MVQINDGENERTREHKKLLRKQQLQQINKRKDRQNYPSVIVHLFAMHERAPLQSSVRS